MANSQLSGCSVTPSDLLVINPCHTENCKQFIALLAKHERRLSGYVLSLVPDWADAEEIVQETKTRLWEQFDQYDPSKDFGAWACTIAYYQILTLRQRSRRQHTALGQEFLDTVAAKFEQVAEGETDRSRALAVCLQKLTPSQRALVKRCYASRAAPTGPPCKPFFYFIC